MAGGARSRETQYRRRLRTLRANRRREAGQRTPDSRDNDFLEATAVQIGPRSRRAETVASVGSLLAASRTSLLANAYGRKR
jgi:hypothetical protein